MIEFKEADQMSVIIFGLFSLVMGFLCYKTIRKSSEWKKWTLIFSALVLFFSGMAFSGLLVKSFVPWGPFLFISLILFAFSFSFSSAASQVCATVPIYLLIGFQVFRIPLEIILHHWASIGTIPDTMTWTGQNWDILSGIISIASIKLVRTSKTTALIVNTVGFLLLINVVRVVILSSPLPFAWHLENPLQLIAYFPYCLIGPMFVLPAMVGHLLVFRKLLGR